MRTLIIVAALFARSLSAFAQAESIPTFTVTSNDVAQSSIRIYPFIQTHGTNENKVSVKFNFAGTGAKRLKEFYGTHSIGQEVRYRIGSFERVFTLDDRKHFEREGYWGLTEKDAKALEAGLRGRK